MSRAVDPSGGTARSAPSELTVLGACHHDCPDTCAWEVTVVDGVATRLRGSTSHPVTRGTLCPKVNRFLDRVHHPDRVLTPLRRTGPKGSAEFEPIGWAEAVAEIAARMRALIDAGRADAILQYSFAGTQGLVQMGVLIDALFDAVGASDVHRELCGTTSWLGPAKVLGRPFGVDPETFRHSRTLVLWGTNTRITNRHFWPVVEEARANGATIVVVDPVRTETAREADVFVQPRPGTDVALVLGLVHVLDRDGLLDPSWLAERTVGWADLEACAAEWAPERTATATGVPAEQIEQLAHLMATQRPTGVRMLIGPEHRENGTEIQRAVAMLPAVLGSWRDVGGGLARSTQQWAFSALSLPHRPQRRSVNMARLGQVLTDPREGDPRIELLFVHNSNPAVIVPDQNRVIEGLEREDLFTVVVEQFVTDTARYADIVLPATTQIEHLDLAHSWGHLYLALNQPATAPRGEALPNTEIARRLATALGLDDPALQRSDEQLVRDLLDSDHPFLDGITYEVLAERGWARLAVPDGLRPHVDDIPGVPTRPMRLGALDPSVGSETVDGDTAGQFPLALISRKQHPKFLNAAYAGFPAHLPSSGRPSLQIHPADAAARGVASGDIVRVHNDRGSLSLAAEVTEDLQPGLVAIPFGWWNRSTPEGRAVNALTNAGVNKDDRGSAWFHDTLVEVERSGATTSR
ncbi:MAG TPA: molybdopterin-dependent oxidoreductase [Candidatus Nanopelagicales bacterium]|nr:molybdopterin-dependent oxidoreductase [Candidatus Nanopelagicales bacterium]